MEAIYQQIRDVYEYIIQFAIIIVDLISAGIICFTIIKSLINLCKHKEDIRLDVSEGILVALEFKLGGEVLRTLIVRDLNELLILGIVIVLMAALSVFVQWGIKNEKKNADVFKKEKNVDFKKISESLKVAKKESENDCNGEAETTFDFISSTDSSSQSNEDDIIKF